MPKAIIDLKIAMNKALRDLAQSGDASNQSVINYLRQNEPKLIAESRMQLEDIAFRRILNDLVSRNSNIFSSSQTDIFEREQGLKSLYSVKVDGKRKRIPVGNVRLVQLIEDLEKKEAKKAQKNDNEKIIQRLKDLLSRSGSEDITYSDALRIRDGASV